ncbi:hypothetical protein BDY24DRAFT_370510 [Mrakia frigida]|uniref:F-box protein n=1 Tax=Mrakia frigida TaxID=29902 RepID=UPI003FCC2591
MTTPPGTSSLDLCCIHTLPVESLNHIFDYLPEEPDKITLSQTCQRFRRILETSLRTELQCIVRAGPCPHTLRELAFTDFALRLRILFVVTESDVVIPAESWKALSSVVAACLPRLPSLETLVLEPDLLDNLLFNNIIQSSISNIQFEKVLRSDRLPLQPSFRARRREGRRDLIVHVNGALELWIGSEDAAKWANRLLELLEYHQVKFPHLHLYVAYSLEESSVLLLQTELQIEDVRVIVSASNSFPLIPWLDRVFESESLPSLESVSVKVQARLTEGDPFLERNSFELSADTWIPCPRLVDMTPATDEEILFDEWGSVDLQSYIVGSCDGQIASFDVQLAPGFELRPPHLLSLALHLPFLATLEISAVFEDLKWSDWPSSVVAFSHLTSLRSLTLAGSLTPERTVEIILACEFCVDDLPTTRPELEQTSRLVGGSNVLWDVGRQINLARLQLLADVLQDGTEICWRISTFPWTDDSDSRWIVYFEGRVEMSEEGGRFVKEQQRGQENELGYEGAYCVSCDEFAGMEPVEALRSCSVEEVRAALQKGGFDLKSFDASPLSVDAGPDSLEVFLRTGSPLVSSLAT